MTTTAILGVVTAGSSAATAESTAIASVKVRSVGDPLTMFGPVMAGPTVVPSGYLTQSADWTLAGSPYVISGEVVVGAGMKLTVHPGVVVKFVPTSTTDLSQNYRSALNVNGGQLIAQGTAADPVVFTSSRDDSVGGDVGGPSGTPQRGDWGQLWFGAYNPQVATTMPTSSLDNVIIRFGGSGIDTGCRGLGMVQVDQTGRLQLSRSEVIRSRGRGIFVDDKLVETGGSFLAQHNLIDENGCGSGINGGDIYNNVFGPSQGMALTVLDGTHMTVYGNHFLSQAGFGGHKTRTDIDVLGNYFEKGVTNESTDSDHDDLRFNGWGFPRGKPNNCQLIHIDYIPAIEWGNDPYACTDIPGTRWVDRYFTDVLPFRGPGPVPEVGPGATVTAPWFLIGVPLEQTFGAMCDCLGDAATQQHLTPLPVNTATGGLVEFFSDAVLESPGLNFEMTRTYNSLDGRSGALGEGWTFAYNVSAEVIPSSGGDVRVRAEDGKQAIFEKQADGTFTRPPGVQAELTSTADGYRLVKSDQSVIVFNSAGQMTSWKDHSGQGLTFGGYETGKLTTVTDSAGRQFALSYTDGRLTTVSLPDGREVIYGYTGGRLTSVKDLRGKTTTYAYNAAGLLESAKDPKQHYLFRNTFDPETFRVVAQLDARGKQTTFEWDPNTETSTTTDPAGKKWVEVYRGNVLQEKRDPLGHSFKFGYDEAMNRTLVIDPRGNETRSTYDAAGNLRTRTSPGPTTPVEEWTYTSFNSVSTYRNGRGHTTTFDYNAAQLLEKVTDPLGHTTQYTYTTRGLVDTITDARGKVTDHDYDAAGNLSSVKSPEGRTTTYTHDSAGRVKSLTSPRGNEPLANPETYTTHYTWDAGDHIETVTDPRDKVTAYTYDDAGNLATVTDPEAHITRYSYGPDNKVTELTEANTAKTITTYDDRSQVASVTTAAGTPDAATTTFTYDAAGQQTTKVTPRGNAAGANPTAFTWTYSYDPSGNLKTESHPTAGTTTYDYDELDRLEKVTDAHGKATQYTWDANGNHTSVTDPLNWSTTFSYDAADQLDTVRDPKLKITDYDYNATGQQSAVTSPLGHKQTWTYDDDGLLATTVDPRGHQSGAIPADFTTTYVHDADGNLKTITDAEARITTYDYDPSGNLERRTDGNGHATAYAYDDRDLLKSVTGPANTGITKYTYDPVGNLRTRTNAKNQVTTWDHDPHSRPTSKTVRTADDALTGKWTYGWDPEDNLITTITPAGNLTPTEGDATITSAYDPLNRLAGIDYSDSTPDVTYTFDELRQRSMTDGAGVETYTWDDAGQLDTVTRGATNYDYDYDALGNITKRTLPGGSIVTQTWNDDSRLTEVNGGTQGSATFGYDAAGNRTSATLGNGIVETRTYDGAGLLSETSAMRGANIVARTTITDRDNVGNPTALVRKFLFTTVNESYTYDNADRVTKACYTTNCNPRIEYTYDSLGNRETETRVGGVGPGVITSTYNAHDQLEKTTKPGALFQPPQVTDFGYDPNGNLTSVAGPTETTTLSYDLENRAKTSTTGTATTSYQYDGNGLRQSATTGAAATNYLWDTQYPNPELVSETTPTGVRRFLNDSAGDALAIFNPGTGTGSGAQYLHTAEVGTVRAATDSTGATRSTYSYEPFGASRNSPTGQASLANPIGFAGEYKDQATGQYHLRARDYSPTTGRFNSLDPIAQDIADPFVNEYIYVNNQPTVLTDPSGLCPNCVKPVIKVVTKLAKRGAAGTAATAGRVMAAPKTLREVLGDAAEKYCRGPGARHADEAEAQMDSVLANGGTVRHSETATAIGDDGATLVNFERSVGANGRHDVIVHGNAAGEPVVNKLVTHPQQIADAILENPAYKGCEITLVMCHGGRGTAQELSKILGVQVHATTREAQLSPLTGRLIQGRF